MSIDNKAIRETTPLNCNYNAIQNKDIDAIQTATRIDERNEVLDEIENSLLLVNEFELFEFIGNNKTTDVPKGSYIRVSKLLDKLTQLRKQNNE